MPSNKIIPYFYVIRHKKSGKLYAGSKTSQISANPRKFMVIGGYLTSSKIVKSIIEKEGIDSFEVIQLITQDEVSIPITEYETIFLKENNVATDENWFNCHENEKLNFTDENQMNKVWASYKLRTGYDHPMYNPKVVEKLRETSNKKMIEKYGVENPMHVKEFIEKAQASREKVFKEKYGVNATSAGSLEWVAKKIKDTMQKRRSPCPYCNKIVNINNSWHFENCREHTDPTIKQINIEKKHNRVAAMLKSRPKKTAVENGLSQGIEITIDGKYYRNILTAMNELKLSRHKIKKLAGLM